MPPARIDDQVSSLGLDARRAAKASGLTLSAGLDGSWNRSDQYNFAARGASCP